MYNGGSGWRQYHDLEYSPFSGTKTDYAVLSGGTGDLTDGIIPANSWNVDDQAYRPYVGWQFSSTSTYPSRDSNEVSIEFFFDHKVTIDSLKISVDDASGGVSPPAEVVIGMVTYTFPPNPGGSDGGPFTAEIQLDPPVTVAVATGLNVTLIQDGEWMFVSEVQFFPVRPTKVSLFAYFVYHSCFSY